MLQTVSSNQCCKYCYFLDVYSYIQNLLMCPHMSLSLYLQLSPMAGLLLSYPASSLLFSMVSPTCILMQLKYLFDERDCFVTHHSSTLISQTGAFVALFIYLLGFEVNTACFSSIVPIQSMVLPFSESI